MKIGEADLNRPQVPSGYLVEVTYISPRLGRASGSTGGSAGSNHLPRRGCVRGLEPSIPQWKRQPRLWLRNLYEVGLGTPCPPTVATRSRDNRGLMYEISTRYNPFGSPKPGFRTTLANAQTTGEESIFRLGKAVTPARSRF